MVGCFLLSNHSKVHRPAKNLGTVGVLCDRLGPARTIFAGIDSSWPLDCSISVLSGWRSTHSRPSDATRVQHERKPGRSPCARPRLCETFLSLSSPPPRILSAPHCVFETSCQPLICISPSFLCQPLIFAFVETSFSPSFVSPSYQPLVSALHINPSYCWLASSTPLTAGVLAFCSQGGGLSIIPRGQDSTTTFISCTVHGNRASQGVCLPL